MDEKKLKECLKVIITKVKDRMFKWCIEGSANLFVQGLKTEMKDLDITTDDEGINIFKDLLKDYVLKDFYSEKIQGKSLICNIEDIEIEINSYGDRKLQIFSKTQFIIWKGLNIPVLPLKYANNYYKEIGRTDKVELISSHLKNLKY